MANLKATLMLTLILALAGCARQLPYLLEAKKTNLITESSALIGDFTTLEGNVDLTQKSDKPVVLVFSQDTCLICAHEAHVIRDNLKTQQTPEKIYLYTILVGAILDEATSWKSTHKIPWSVGIDTDSKLFSQYCREQSVPCTVVYLPGRGVVLRKNGEVELSEITNLTGPWE